MSLKVNFDYIPEHCMVDFEENALRVKSIDKMIQLKTGKGNDFLGWVDYPVNYNKEEVERIIAKAESFKKNYEILVVCGIGGSYLGARAAIEALNGLLPHNKKGMEVLYLGKYPIWTGDFYGTCYRYGKLQYKDRRCLGKQDNRGESHHLH